jgi:hypothetical protein
MPQTLCRDRLRDSRACAKIDIDHIPQRHDVRKADPARRRPIEHRRDHRARLAEESDVPRRGRQMGEGGVEPEARHRDPDAVRPDEPQEMRLRRREGRLLQAAALIPKLAKTGGNDDGGTRAELAQLADQARAQFAADSMLEGDGFEL